MNIPATIFATAVYELLLRDSIAIIGKGHNTHEDGEDGLMRHLSRTGTIEQGVSNTLRGQGSNGYASGNGHKHDSLV